jgi:PAS domain S-box-containing protein
VTGTRLRVLLVEDDPGDSFLTQDMLARVESTRFDVDWAASYDEAMAAIRRGGHDVGLVDYRLGSRTGIDLIREARDAGCRAPLILLTGEGTEGVDVLALRHGAADYIAKGELQPHLLERAIRYAIERLHVAAALTESNERFQGAFNAAAIGIAVVALDGHPMQANAALCRMLGYSEADLLQLAYPAFTHPDDVVADQTLAAELVAGERQSYQLEKRYIRRDGQIVWGVLSVSVVRDRERAPLYFVAQVQDITGRREAEAAMLEAERRFRAIFNNSFQLTGLLAPDGTIVEINQATLEFLGLEREALLGRVLWEMPCWDGGELPELMQHTVQEAAAGRFVRSEVIMRGVDGQAVLDFSIKPVLDEQGQVSMLIPEGRDISELKELEERLRQAQRLEAVGQLAGGVAHDFNNLLTAILTDCELLRQELQASDTTTALAVLDEIRSASERAASLIAQLLAFSRKQVLQPRIFDLNEIVASLEGILQRLIGEHIRFSTCLSEVPLRVFADPVQIQQVVLNLVVNGRDAMPKGGALTVTTRLRTLGEPEAIREGVAHPGPCVVVKVTDEGIGMTPETMARIFEPFFTTKEPGKGTGLGLATAWGIVKQSGGSITVESTPGAGSTFSVLIPLERRSAPRPPKPESILRPEAACGTETLLVTEDDVGIRRSVRRLLERQGYSVLTAADASEALRLLGEPDRRVDLLITDIVMPGMSGPELSSHVRALYPEVKVLFMSGYTTSEVFRDDLATGSLAFLPKPFTMQELAHKVRSVLDTPAPRPGGGGQMQ